MPHKSLTVPVCLLFAAVSVASAQQGHPRTAVVPLNAVSVSKADATALTGLLEVALVKTEVFDVLEQGQVEAILEAQEKSVADCTDEKCAIDFGKLLAAEQIVLGSVASVGGKLIMSAKIIDVTTGRTLRADTVEAATLSALTGEVELLAYKLAGLTIRAAGQEQVARAFGELFVETDPPGAEIILNGLPKGTSPLVLERVPIGRVSLETRKDTLYAAREVEVTADSLIKVKLELKVSLGNLFVKSSVKEGISVYLDDKVPFDLKTGLIENLAAGEHQIVLSGIGYAWQGKAVVQTGKTVTVEAYLREVGSVLYAYPLDAQAEITGGDYRMVVRGSGILQNVPTGTYAVRVTGKDWESEDSTFAVNRGENTTLNPAMKRTEAYRRTALYDDLSAAVERVAGLAAEGHEVRAGDVEEAAELERRLAAAEFRFADLVDRARALHEQIGRAELTARLSEIEQLGAGTGPRDAVQADVAVAESLSTEIAASLYATDDLRTRGSALVYALKVRLLEDRKDALEARLAQATRTRRSLRTVGWVAAALGVAAAGLGGTSYALGSGAYADYMAAGDGDGALAAWRRVSSFGALFNVGIVGGSVGLSLGPILLLVAPRTAQISQDLAAVERDLTALRSQGR